MVAAKRSLSEFYPHQRIVPLLIGGSITLLIGGLSLPIVTVQKQILWRTIENTYSVAAGVKDLAAQGDYLLAAIVFFFSMIFPFAKLGGLWWLWNVKLYEDERRWLLQWLGGLGKWSMLDVFAVAILVVLAKLRTLTQVEPRVGIYVFGAAIVASMLTTSYVDRLVRQARRAHRAPARIQPLAPLSTMTGA
ncbi:MAG: paraquat-inducible protein A [Candidatus Omnitrophica bacterium]|nr:paraquat-inducible protein A [Candidatus Omnitrophota bacterium]